MHTRARENFNYFSQKNAHLLTSSFVLVETMALLQRRIGLEPVVDFNTKLLPLIDVVWVNNEWYTRAVQRLLIQRKKDVSLVDCLSFEIMEAKDIKLAYTFDKHFEENGFIISDFKS
jgi:predicted nucleic acid-binding protein